MPVNTLIFSEGDQADNMYFIATGLIQVFMGKDRAQPQELARLAEGDYFGDQGFLAMNKGVRTASVQTLEPTRELLVSGKTFKKVIAKSTKLNTRLESIGKEQQEIRKNTRNYNC